MTTLANEPKPDTAPAGLPRAVPGFTDQLIEPFSRLRGEIERLFDDFRAPPLRFTNMFAMTVPALEMTETKSAYKITAELPGIESDDVEVSVDEGMLRLAGEKKTEREEDEKGYQFSERSYGAFERVVRLPAAADPARIKAKFRNGVLTVTIPKNKEAAQRTRRIAVDRG